MKNAFLSFLESFASSRSAAALDRNRDAFFVKGRAKLTSDVSLRRPQTPNRRSARPSGEFPRRSGSLSFVSTRSKVKFLLFFRIVGNFTIFHKKSQEQTDFRRSRFRRRKPKRDVFTILVFLSILKTTTKTPNKIPPQRQKERRRIFATKQSSSRAIL